MFWRLVATFICFALVHAATVADDDNDEVDPCWWEILHMERSSSSTTAFTLVVNPTRTTSAREKNTSWPTRMHVRTTRNPQSHWVRTQNILYKRVCVHVCTCVYARFVCRALKSYYSNLGQYFHAPKIVAFSHVFQSVTVSSLCSAILHHKQGYDVEYSYTKYLTLFLTLRE